MGKIAEQLEKIMVDKWLEVAELTPLSKKYYHNLALAVEEYILDSKPKIKDKWQERNLKEWQGNLEGM